MYALYPVTDKVFTLSLATLCVISAAITLVSGVFFRESRSDTVCWGNHNTTIPVIDTSRKAFWDAMFLQDEKGEQFCFSKWKTNGAGWKIVEEMERDHSFCGSMSTTRSHSRNQDPPHWNYIFVSTAAHLSAVSIAIIMKTGMLEIFPWLLLAYATIHSASIQTFFKRWFQVIFTPIHKKVQKHRMVDKSKTHVNKQCSVA